MSELVSAFPTSGGIYWWASKLGGAKAGYYTGWLNLIGLLAIDASVAYGCATFFDLTLDTYSTSWAADYSLNRVFLIFLVVLVLVALVNIFSSHLLADPEQHLGVVARRRRRRSSCSSWSSSRATTRACRSVFTHTVNNTGFFGGHTGRRSAFFFYVLPLVGDPDPVHDHRLRRVGPPVRGDPAARPTPRRRASGARSSTPAIGGWILLLAFLFAVQDEARRHRRRRRRSRSSSARR